MRNTARLWIVIAAVCAAGMWLYTDHVLVPSQRAQAVRLQIPRGNLSDLYPRWLGTREYLLHGRDPYGPEVTRESQIGYWGRPLDPNKPNDPKDEARFAYPVYVMFLLAPTIGLPFKVVQWTFVVLLALLTGASVPLWMRAIGLRVERATLAAAILLAMGSWPVVQGLHVQNLTLLVGALLAASAVAVVRGNFVLGGVLLAFATMKPQLAAPVIAWYSVWTLGDLRRRYRLMIAFAGAMALLLGASELLMRGWIWRFQASLVPYLRYNEALDLMQTIFGRVVGRVLKFVLLTVIAVACWWRRREPADSPSFAWILVLVLSGNLVLMPKWASYDQVLLLPAVFWLAARCKQIASGRSAFIYGIVGLPLAWQWMAAIALALMATVASATAQRLAIVPLIPTLAVPVAVLCALIMPHAWRGYLARANTIAAGSSNATGQSRTDFRVAASGESGGVRT